MNKKLVCILIVLVASTGYAEIESFLPKSSKQEKQLKGWRYYPFAFNGEKFSVLFPKKPKQVFPSEDEYVARFSCSRKGVNYDLFVIRGGASDQDAFFKDAIAVLTEKRWEKTEGANETTHDGFPAKDGVVRNPRTKVYGKVRMVFSDQNTYVLLSAYQKGTKEYHSKFVESFTFSKIN